MDSLRQFWARVAGIFGRRHREAEMAEEMRQHLEQRIAEKISAGLSPAEARDAARRDFGAMARVQGAQLLVRDFSGRPGLGQALRITVGSPEQNDQLIRSLAC